MVLEDFAHGRGQLAADVLQALTVDLFGGAAVYDSELDLLRSANRQAPRVMAVRPPSVLEMDDLILPTFAGGPIEHAPRPHKPEPAQPKAKRPGWVD
jgi:hypothetical protein